MKSAKIVEKRLSLGRVDVVKNPAWVPRCAFALAAFVSVIGIGTAQRALALGGGVVYIDPKGAYFIIETRGLRKVRKGTAVCLLDESGTVVTCGAVLISNSTKAGLRLPPTEMKKIRLGAVLSMKPIYLKDNEGAGDVFRAAQSALDAQAREAGKEAEKKDAAIAREEKARDADAEGGGGSLGGWNQLSPVETEGPELGEDAEATPSKTVSDGGGDKPKIPHITPPYEPPLSSARVEILETLYTRSIVRANILSLATLKETGATADTLWQKNSRARQGALSTIAAQMRIHVKGSLRMSAGLRLRRDEKAGYLQPMDANFPSLYSASQTKLTDTGAWFEISRAIKTSRFTWNQICAGFDADTSDLSFKSVRSNPDGTASNEIIAVARSRLTILSYRVELAQDVAWGRFGVSLGVVFLKPFKVVGNSYDSTVIVPKSVSLTQDARGDLKAALNHGAEAYGLDAHLGLFYKF